MRMKCKQEKRDTSAAAKNISECQQTILALEKKVKVLATQVTVTLEMFHNFVKIVSKSCNVYWSLFVTLDMTVWIILCCESYHLE